MNIFFQKTKHDNGSFQQNMAILKKYYQIAIFDVTTKTYRKSDEGTFFHNLSETKNDEKSIHKYSDNSDLKPK